VPLDAADAVMQPLRRSGRVANLPDKPAYREVGVKGFLFLIEITKDFIFSPCFLLEQIAALKTN
jgi:hypothetical protein